MQCLQFADGFGISTGVANSEAAYIIRKRLHKYQNPSAYKKLDDITKEFLLEEHPKVREFVANKFGRLIYPTSLSDEDFSFYLNLLDELKEELKWDRFSRNVAESYAMIHQLNKLGIEPQAIEQPLDMSIPESKIMLAIYLVAPEVENDRRALNVIAGMRKAMKEGRHVNMAPKGYRNVRDGNNNPTIEPGKDAPIIKWAFEEVQRGVYNVMDIWRMSKQKGLKVGKSQIWNIFRNPFYCGKLFIPAYKNEEARVVKGIHTPIISEALFNDV